MNMQEYLNLSVAAAESHLRDFWKLTAAPSLASIQSSAQPMTSNSYNIGPGSWVKVDRMLDILQWQPRKEINPEVSGGTKYDDEKPRMDLLDSEWLENVSKVLTFGAKKYDAHDWRKGIKYSRLIAAAYRHLGAINRGEDIDPESGLPHAAHLSCCVMFLDTMIRTRKDLDDRYKNSPVD